MQNAWAAAKSLSLSKPNLPIKMTLIFVTRPAVRFALNERVPRMTHSQSSTDVRNTSYVIERVTDCIKISDELAYLKPSKDCQVYTL